MNPHPTGPPESTAPEGDSQVNLGAIERRSLLLILLLTASSLVFRSSKITLGVAVGGVLSLLNYFWLKRFVGALLLRRGGRVGILGVLLYFLKYVITGVVIFAFVARGAVNIFALLAGLLAVIIAITLEGVIKTFRIRKEKENAP